MIFFQSDGLGKKLQDLLFSLVSSNPTVIAVHFLSSIFVIIFIVYYFWKPTNAFLAKQKDKLDKVHTQLASATKETKVALSQLKTQQSNLKEEEKRIITEQKQKAEKILSQKLEEAEKLKQSIIEESKRKAQQIEEEAKKTINGKVIDLSVELAEKLVGVSINQKTHNKLVNEYISDINKAFREKEEIALS
ncbi:F0F1 ATP synthase subunit B family protein [Mycoplasma suis]|uniref:ATP synthase subunit b n=1 Tax=Mycoplasma suis (strain Illinois) TaxID=768700 RepID=F0QRC5_MYCSL|nr:ATP synthase F0 subunit beta [Mycoplasma suis]ADX98045.1 ATP synthase F0, B subunit [Mycoplasma suis str. Illinois]